MLLSLGSKYFSSVFFNSKYSTVRSIMPAKPNEANDEIDEAPSMSMDIQSARFEKSGAFSTRTKIFRAATNGSTIGKTKNPSGLSKLFTAFLGHIKRFGEAVARYLQRVLTLPMIRGEPVSFSLPDNFNSSGKPNYKEGQEEYEKEMDLLEAVCNYDEKTKDVFQKIINDRKEFIIYNKRYTKDIDWSKLAPWKESYLGHLESIFKVFDSTEDALLDFDEMSVVLIDYGDKTDPDVIREVFMAADESKTGTLTFTEFVTMYHSIMVKSPEKYPSTMVDTFRAIDRNMARIKGLDVVQQLQTGLF